MSEKKNQQKRGEREELDWANDFKIKSRYMSRSNNAKSDAPVS